MTQSKNRRGFTKEFKIDAVKLVTEQGYKLSEAARNLGIDPSVLRRWKDQMSKDAEQAFPGKGCLSTEKEELHRLRKEVKRLQMERDILKKATAFFANLSK
jgi:transposase